MVARSSFTGEGAGYLGTDGTSRHAQENILDVEVVVRSSDIVSCTAFSSLAAFPRSSAWVELEVSLEKKLLSDEAPR